MFDNITGGIPCTNDQSMPGILIFFSLNVQVYIRASKKVSFQLPKKQRGDYFIV